jgi:hypothetical protein
MFTKNCRESYRTFPFFRKFFELVYEKTRLPLMPIFGAFPVKLITYLGEPIKYNPDRTPEELKELVSIGYFNFDSFFCPVFGSNRYNGHKCMDRELKSIRRNTLSPSLS